LDAENICVPPLQIPNGDINNRTVNCRPFLRLAFSREQDIILIACLPDNSPAQMFFIYGWVSLSDLFEGLPFLKILFAYCRGAFATPAFCKHIFYEKGWCNP
jgi:hypothetical protein